MDCSQLERGKIRIIARDTISPLFDPAEVCKGNHVKTSPLPRGEYEGEKVVVPIGEKNVVWIVIFDHNDERWKGRAEGTLRNDPNITIEGE